ncbi:MAG TPA: sensor histidine kinase [Ktedonobacteraceae bacterium]|nr:sensor histidine kinase [Ktedonobacteraceae bacterium]
MALVSLGLLTWSLVNYRIQPTQPIFYGSRAIYSTLLLALVLAVLGRILLLRILKLEIGNAPDSEPYRNDTWRLLLLLDVVAPIYLTAGVLLGLYAAVLVALITQFVVQGYTFMRGLISWKTAMYHVTATGVLVLIASALFKYIESLFRAPHMGASYLESWELIATLLATTAMTLLLVLVSLPTLMQSRRIGLRAAWSAYYHSPVLRFQILVMSVTPLLPVVDIFDNEVAELAWIFFLVPLLAIYYLALISTRLSLRTEELQSTLEDLSSARRRQDELRGYASLITRVQEDERKRLARELHDDTAQALIALARGLDGLGRAVEKQQLPQKDRDWLANLQDLADHTLDSVRRACRDLRPSILDDLGLRAALEWLCDSSSDRGVVSSFSCSGALLPTAPEAEIAIFRIAQEALSNVWRHARARCVEVELTYQLNALCLRIQDDGRGFWPEQIADVQHNSQSGLGLLGMRERAMLIGAELSIDAQPGSGCVVVLRLPLEAAVKDFSSP